MPYGRNVDKKKKNKTKTQLILLVGFIITRDEGRRERF